MRALTPRARAAMTFALGALSLAALLGIQHKRHGWPFSLHHGLTVEGAEPRPPRATTRGRDGGVVHPRAAVTLAPERLESLGIRVAEVESRSVTGELRAVATIVPDEGRVSHVHTRVSGFIERLTVRTTGESVRAGQVVASIFSQELLASQSEYLGVLRASSPASPSPLARGARERLRVLGMTDAAVTALEQRGTPSRSVPIVAPHGGVVLERGVTVGTAVDPSTELFVIADLTRVWVLAEVPEARAADVRVGTHARIEAPASGLAPIDAAVDFVYPTLTESTRTLRVRLTVPNPTGALRPGTFATVTLHVAPRTTLVVPRDAIVDTGSEQHAFVVEHEGHFVPRTVRVGARLEESVEILEGLVEGERVVASGVFLLDSESRLRASGGGGGHAHGAPAARAPDAGRAAPSAPAPASGHSGHGG